MKRAALVLFLLAACAKVSPLPQTSPAPDGPVKFRVLSEGQNAAFCVQAPEFDVATDEDTWIDLFDMHTACQPLMEVMLPEVDFPMEVAVAAWWKREGCLGHSIATRSVARSGDAVVVTATSAGPGGACASAIGQLESFLALEKSERYTGSEPLRFVLDGRVVGTAGPGRS